jgi:hypothetical protein
MSQRCSVLRVIPESDLQMKKDSEGRHVIPILDSGKDKYEALVKVLHGVVRSECLDFIQALGVADASKRLGADDVSKEAIVAAWYSRPSIEHVIHLIPDLLRLSNRPITWSVTRAIAKRWEMFSDFRTYVLEPLAPVLDPQSALVLAQELGRFYPPAATVSAILDVVKVPSEYAIRILEENSKLFSPAEFFELAKLFLEDANPTVCLFAKTAVSSWQFAYPLRQKADETHGMRIQFEDGHTIFNIGVPRRKRTIVASDALTLHMPTSEDPRFAVDINPSELDKDVWPRTIWIRVFVTRNPGDSFGLYECIFQYEVEDPRTRVTLRAGDNDMATRRFLNIVRIGKKMNIRVDVKFGEQDLDLFS